MIEVEGNTVTITETEKKPVAFDLHNIPGLQNDIDSAAQELLAHADDDAEGDCVMTIKIKVDREDLKVTAVVGVTLPKRIGYAIKSANAVRENGRLCLPEPKQTTLF